MKHLLLMLGLMFVGSFLVSQTADATSLKVAPLQYRTSLAQAEKKKGFIDVSNPTDQKMIIRTSVQALKQVDDQGTIQFYDSEQLAQGVLLDLDEFELGPKEAIRMYFLLDGSKLPTGDVYGAIFFTTSPSQATAGVGQSVRLGTVFSVVNGTPGSRQASITGFDVPQFTFNPQVKGNYTIKNTADPTKATGFYPQVNIKTIPFGESKEDAGKLVFAGRSRVNEFTINLPPIGIYRIEARYGGSSEGKWVAVVHPVALAAVAVLLAGSVMGRRYLRRRTSLGFQNKQR
jgi:hypothetical protein